MSFTLRRRDPSLHFRQLGKHLALILLVKGKSASWEKDIVGISFSLQELVK